jgi:hypothetical protein
MEAVRCRDTFLAEWVACFGVVSMFSKTFALHMGECVEVFSVDWLKPNTGEAPVNPQAPPVRGRLRGISARIFSCEHMKITVHMWRSVLNAWSDAREKGKKSSK